MKSILIILLILFVESGQGQESTAWERSVFVIGASAIYVGYDYFVYAKNQWKAGTVEEITFRISQLALLGGLTWFLVDHFGWKTGIAFGILYFSWNFDAAYYWLHGRDAWQNEVESNSVTWAKHTPAGWFESPTSAKTLKIQMSFGIGISIALLL
jgi:hypothetical protein